MALEGDSCVVSGALHPTLKQCNFLCRLARWQLVQSLMYSGSLLILEPEVSHAQQLHTLPASSFKMLSLLVLEQGHSGR
jgi:hypothetical protein